MFYCSKLSAPSSVSFLMTHLTDKEALYLPLTITNDIKGIINAINLKLGINKFLFEGLPGSGKTEAVKHLARLSERKLFYVDFLDTNYKYLSIHLPVLF